MTAFETAVYTASLLPLCKACVSSAGLCHWHAEHDRATREGDGVMPLLTPNSINVRALSGRWHELHKADTMPSGNPMAAVVSPPLGQPGRKVAKAANRLERAMAGEFTRSRPKEAA